MLPGRASALGLVFLAAVACGGGSSSSLSASTATTTAPPPTTAPPARTEVPDAVVRDVGTGADVNLRALGLPERPTLYWFWAPH